MDDGRLPCHVIGSSWSIAGRTGCSRTRRHGRRDEQVRSVYAMCGPTVRETSPSPSDAPVVLRMP